MAGYLRRYVGQYRVKADYDWSTNDFPRKEDGSLDHTFDDLYIDCANNIKIRHGVGSVLSCHIPSKSRGSNILRRIYEDQISNKLPTKDNTYHEKLCSELVDKGVLISAEVLDFEVYFEFSADMIDYVATIVGARTYGASISPMSSRNLPRAKYKIPEEDMKLYQAATKNFPTKTVEIGGKPRTMIDGVLIMKANKEFDKIILKSKPKQFDIDKDRKQKGLKGKEYIHSLGNDIWNQYCEFLKTFANNKEK